MNAKKKIWVLAITAACIVPLSQLEKSPPAVEAEDMAVVMVYLPPSEPAAPQVEARSAPTAADALAAGKEARERGRVPTMRATLEISNIRFFDWEYQQGSRVVLVADERNFEVRNGVLVPIGRDDFRGFSVRGAEDVTEDLDDSYYDHFSRLTDSAGFEDFMVVVVKPQDYVDRVAGHVKLLLERRGIVYQDVSSVHYTVMEDDGDIAYRVDTVSYRGERVDIAEVFHPGGVS